MEASATVWAERYRISGPLNTCCRLRQFSEDRQLIGIQGLIMLNIQALTGLFATTLISLTSASQSYAEQYQCSVEAEVQNWKGQGTGKYLKSRDWTLASDGNDLGAVTLTISADGTTGRVQRQRTGSTFDSDSMMGERFSVTRTEYARVFVTHITTYVVADLPNITTLSIIEQGNAGYAAFGSCNRVN